MQTILVVNPDSVWVQALQRSLKILGGFRVFEASSGAQALNILSTVQVDLILVGQSLSEEKNGWFIQQLKAITPQELPVIISKPNEDPSKLAQILIQKLN